MKRVFLFVVLTVMAADAAAQCNLNLQKRDLGRGRSWELSWSTVPGIEDYLLELIREDERTGTTTTRRIEIDSRGASKVEHDVAIESTVALKVVYRVVAVGTVQPCSATITVDYPDDPDLKQIARRSIIPLVGSTRGAGGSLFKTSLRLRATRANQRGTLVFHPANVPASNNDPRIPYHLPTSTSVLEWDDVVAEFGVAGIGSIDIVPAGAENGWTVPAADVRLFNVATNGTYGAAGVQTQAGDFLLDSIDPLTEMTVVVPSSELRVNLAIRTFDAARGTIEVRRDGTRLTIRPVETDRETLIFNSANNLTGVTLEPGDVIIIRMTEGGGIPMYTLTDNRTNDPSLHVPATRVQYDMEVFDVGF